MQRDGNTQRSTILPRTDAIMTDEFLRYLAVHDAEAHTAEAPQDPNNMVFIPGGEFIMGVKDGDNLNEFTEMRVYVAPFYVDVQPVTWRDYQKFIA